MIRRAYAQNCPHCGGHAHNLADDSPAEFELNKLYLNLVKKVFKEGARLSPAEMGIDEPTTLNNAKAFMSGVFEGYGGDFASFEWGSPDYQKLAHIERNVYTFSGAKNWQQLRDLTSAIREGDRILPYKEFRNKALSILGEYQGRWLQTEYNAAIAGSQMASKWVTFEQYPEHLLEYRTMEDGRVREEHALLDKITRPVKDKFWDTYYPPNGFNCRCTAIELNDGKATATRKLEYPDIPKMFQVNLGKEGLVFPKSHPYYIGIPKDVKTQINNLVPDHPKP